jgi:hypothetical protein
VRLEWGRTLSGDVLELGDGGSGEVDIVENETLFCAVAEGLDDADGEGSAGEGTRTVGCGHLRER